MTLRAILKNNLELMEGIPLFSQCKPYLSAAFLFSIFVLLLSWFEEVVDDVLEGDTHKIDKKILEALRHPGDMSDPIGPHWLQEMMRDFTSLGGIGILLFITLSAAIYLFIINKRVRGIYLLCAIGTGTILSNVLKAGFDRPRPEIERYETYVATASLPSGHSMMATLVYLTLGALLAEAQPNRNIKIFFVSISVLVALIVGISRVYLGAHWPSDVLAGWLLGSAWALMFWMMERYLFNREYWKRKA